MDKQYKKLEFWCGNDIQHAVNELLEYRRKGILACGTFNGITLYSDTVTLDNAYIEITGKTKAEIDREKQEWMERYDREEREHKDNIPILSMEWMQKGRKVLTEDKWEYWDKIVPIRLNDLYHGIELGNCLDIINILNNDGTLEEAKEKIESQGHSGMSYGLVRAMVKEFCSRGEEFSNFIYN